MEQLGAITQNSREASAVKQSVANDLDIWGRPEEERPMLVAPCTHERRIYTGCGSWRCGDCGERLV